MPSALLLVHTGTGNSLRVARWLAGLLRTDGREEMVTEVAAGQDVPSPPAGDGDLLVLVFPTHGFTMPWHALRHALALPRGRGAALVLAVRGGTRLGRWLLPGAEGTAGVLAAAILAAKGWRVRGWRGIDMPVNWTQVHSALGERSVALIGERARAQLADVAARLRAGRAVLGVGTLLQTALGVLLAPLSLAYLLAGRQLLARLFVASPACNGCGTCRAGCPHGAIAWFRRRPYWTHRCESCMRCMALCPQRAVQATQALGAVYALLGGAVAAAVGAVLAGWWPVLTPALDGWLPRLLLTAAVLAPVLALAYAAAWLLGCTPVLGWLVHGLTLTRWYRRPALAPGELRAAVTRAPPPPRCR